MSWLLSAKNLRSAASRKMKLAQQMKLKLEYVTVLFEVPGKKPISVPTIAVGGGGVDCVAKLTFTVVALEAVTTTGPTRGRPAT